MNCKLCGNSPKGADKGLLPGPYFVCSSCRIEAGREHYNRLVKQAQELFKQGSSVDAISSRLDVCEEQIAHWITKERNKSICKTCHSYCSFQDFYEDEQEDDDMGFCDSHHNMSVMDTDTCESWKERSGRFNHRR